MTRTGRDTNGIQPTRCQWPVGSNPRHGKIASSIKEVEQAIATKYQSLRSIFVTRAETVTPESREGVPHELARLNSKHDLCRNPAGLGRDRFAQAADRRFRVAAAFLAAERRRVGPLVFAA